MKKLILTLPILLLTSCAFLGWVPTPYQEENRSGGYSSMKLNKEVFRVKFQGNGYTRENVVHKYFLRRCAEITEQEGYQYFAFAEKSEETLVENTGSKTSGSISKDPYSNSYNYSARSSNDSITRFRRDGIIKLFKEGEQPSISYSANEILKPYRSL